MKGAEPTLDTDYNAAKGHKKKLSALIEVCQSMHMVTMPTGNTDGDRGTLISSPLNPAELVCTCKGYRQTSNCAHQIAINALYVKDNQCISDYDNYDRSQLEAMLEKVCMVLYAPICTCMLYYMCTPFFNTV